MNQTWTVTSSPGATFSFVVTMPSNVGLRGMLLRRWGLGPDATSEVIRARYRQLAKEHHPDAGGDPERFRQLQETWETLKELGA